MTTAQESTSSLATEPPVLPAAIRHDLDRGQALLVTTPQSATAAHIAEYAISCARRDGRSAFYAGPNEALALRRYRQWQAALGPDEVGLLTKSVRHRPAAPLVVGTPATLRSVLFTAHDRLRDAGYVIFDDIDLLSDPEQETAWEELVIQLSSAVPLLCLSSPVGNAEELTAWLTQVRGTTRLRRHEARAVPLEHLYLWDNRLHPLVGTDGGAAAEVPPVGGEAQRPRSNGRPSGTQPLETPNAADVLRVLRRAELLPALCYVSGQRSCEQRAAECAPAARRGPRSLQRKRRALVRSYIHTLPAEDRELPQVGRLTALIAQGVAVYHAGLLPALQRLVEALLDADLLDIVFATAALANESTVTARTVVVGEPTAPDRGTRRSLSTAEYARLARSAGRPGDALASVVNVYSPWLSAREIQALATTPPEPFRSVFQPRLQSAVVLDTHNGAAHEQVRRLLQATLRRHQTDNAVGQATAAADGLRRSAAAHTFDCPMPDVEATALDEYRQLRLDAGRLRRVASQQAFRALRLRGVTAGSANGAGATAAEVAAAEQAAQESEAAAKQAALESHASPCHSCTSRREHEQVWRRRAAVEKDLPAALAEVERLEAEATAQGDALADGILATLQRYGRNNGPCPKTALLARIDHPAGLVLAEAMWRGVLDDLSARDLLEALSWFCNDRDVPGYNRYFVSVRLLATRERLQALATEIADQADQAGAALARGPNPMFHGPVQDWSRGAAIASILEKMDIAAGDLVLTLHRTLDLARQLRQALAGAANTGDDEWAARAQRLRHTLDQGTTLVRRGLVAQSTAALTGVT